MGCIVDIKEGGLRAMHNADEYRIRIAEQLKAARIAAGITVTEVADLLGKKNSTVYSYELGRIAPTADVFLQLMVLYGINDFDFFSPDKKERTEVVNRSDDSINEFADLLRNVDSQSIKAVKAMLQVLQEKPDRDDKIVNFNR